MPKKQHPEQDAPDDVKAQVVDALDKAYIRAEAARATLPTGEDPISSFRLSERLRNSLDFLTENSSRASTGFTNIVTSLAIKVAKPQVDIRYHQVQIQGQTDRPAGFNFRGVSEKTVYPWLTAHDFEGARSGWQTRTFERPKPYMQNYDENIGVIKDAFLATFDEIEVQAASAPDALAYLMYHQLLRRDKQNITLAVPKTREIRLIVQMFENHFFHEYTDSKGASRLPVLAVYAIYSVMLHQLKRYEGMILEPLQEHSAADSQTGAIGDIEVLTADESKVFEAIEIKHDIPISNTIIISATKKIMNKSVDRYYILTTHANCEPNDGLQQLIVQAKALYECQMIANGVIPTIRYYLRLLSDPSAVFPVYVELLNSDKAIAYEHREEWNSLATSGGIDD